MADTLLQTPTYPTGDPNAPGGALPVAPSVKKVAAPVVSSPTSVVAPKVSTTTISNTNKIEQVPAMVSSLETLSTKGITYDTSGIPRYADGSIASTMGYTDEHGYSRDATEANISQYKPLATKYTQANAATADPTGTELADTSVEDKATNDILDQMKASLDSTTKSLIDNIQQKFEMRRQEQKDVNMRQKRGYENALLMGSQTGQGSSVQFAPISSEGIIGAQEAYGIRQIAELDSQEQDLIAEAKAAQQTGDFKIMSEKLGMIEKKRAEKVAAATKLNETIIAQNKKLREDNIVSARDTSVASLYAQGVTDVPSILASLKKQGVTATAAQIADTIKNIVPPGLDDLVKTLRNNGAPQEVISKVLASGDINEAYKNAGVYSAGGTGIIGEYNFYRAQAEAKGQVPVDFNTYQNMDANRKAKVAAAGVGGGSPGSGKNGTFGTDLEALIDNVKNTIPTKFGQATFDQTIAKARNDGDKIRTIATIALKNSPSEIKTDFVNQTVGIKELDKAIKLIDEGAQTGVLNAAQQYTYNLAGKDFDPKLAAINAYIVSAIQPYRSSVTGAAWGTQEEAEYQALFGSTKYSPTELKQRLERVKEIMKDKSITALYAQIDPLGTENNVFETTGTMTKNLVETESQAKTSVDSFYKTTSPQNRDIMKTLFTKNYTNAQVLEYLRLKKLIQ